MRIFYNFGCKEEVYGMGIFMSAAGLNFPTFVYDIVRTHTFMIYSVIDENNFEGNTKVAFCFAFRL